MARTAASGHRSPVGLLGSARNTTLGWCASMAARVAGRSSSSPAVSGTPTKRACDRRAAMSKYTKEGQGDSTVSPGSQQAWMIRWMSSSEPLPNSRPAWAGTSNAWRTWACSAGLAAAG
ncbi:Uncharacterised protein [Bordetella pertussis]|nr:Uncharacterised protein [Bordetella pertussis]CFP60145.1 Uncharacterised protein [Bordetella pertussis]CFW31015.1 Uncharacterised protein [Bordetella pertussis]